MLNRLLRAAFVCAVLASLVLAADVSGKWKGQIEGSDQDTVFDFKVDGTALSGTMTREGGKAFPLKGSIDGDKISFTVDSEWQGSPAKLIGKGTVSGDRITLNLASDNGAWSTDLTIK